MPPLNHLCFFVCFCPPKASSNSRSRHATVKNTITNMSCSLRCLDEQFHEDSRSTSRNDKTCLDTDAYKNIKSSNFLQIIFQTDLNHLTTAAKSVVAMNTYFFHVQDLRENFFEISFSKDLKKQKYRKDIGDCLNTKFRPSTLLQAAKKTRQTIRIQRFYINLPLGLELPFSGKVVACRSFLAGNF